VQKQRMHSFYLRALINVDFAFCAAERLDYLNSSYESFRFKTGNFIFCAINRARTLIQHMLTFYVHSYRKPCGGMLEFLHRSPVSRKRRRKGSPGPGGITGPPCSWGI
jgi:hypothetical protein